MVCHNFQWNGVSADPPVEDGLADGWGFLVGQGDEFDVLGESVGDCQDVPFASSEVTKRSKKVCMDPLIRLCRLRQRRQECRSWTVIISADLAFVTGFQVVTNVGIHARPIVTLKNVFFCLVNAVMASEEVAVCFLKDFVDESLG